MIAVKARITVGREEPNKLPDIDNLIVMTLTPENVWIQCQPRINVIGFTNVGFLIEGFTEEITSRYLKKACYKYISLNTY